MKICSKCGERNEDWMNLCQRCGSSIENADQDNTEVTYEFEKDKYDVSNNGVQQSYGFEEESSESTDKKAFENMDLKIILAILLVILGFLIVLALGKL